MAANTFGISICTVSKIIREVCSALTYKLGPKYIRLPQTEEEMIEKQLNLYQSMGCIRRLGALMVLMYLF